MKQKIISKDVLCRRWIAEIASLLLILGGMSCITNPTFPNSQLPRDLKYPSDITTTFGKTAASEQPSITSNTAVTYSMEVHLKGHDQASNPDNDYKNLILINAETGIISVKSHLYVGEYKITVFARNASGTATFPDVFTVQMEPRRSSYISYDVKIKTILDNKCNSCHSTNNTLSIPSWENYYNTRINIDKILMRIKTQKDMPPPNSGKVISTSEVANIEQWLEHGLPRK